MKDKTCCFTGHRPKNIPWIVKESSKQFKECRKKLKETIQRAIEMGYNIFISGMALGVDTVAAELVLELKKKYPNIKLECAIPCLNQDIKWCSEYKKRYKMILTRADKITFISRSKYFNGCMQKRNKYMVDNSKMLIAVYDGISKGGTRQTIDYANNKKLDMILLGL